MELKVGSYDATSGLRLIWDDDFAIGCILEGAQTVIKGNRAGLISLARHLLTLAGEDVPSGTHLHLDSSTWLDDGSHELIIERA